MNEINDEKLFNTSIWLGFWFLVFTIGYIKHLIDKKKPK